MKDSPFSPYLLYLCCILGILLDGKKKKKIKLDSYLFEGFLMSQIMVHHEKTHRNTFAVYSKHKLGIFLQKAKKKEFSCLVFSSRSTNQLNLLVSALLRYILKRNGTLFARITVNIHRLESIVLCEKIAYALSYRPQTNCLDS